jgi:Flp pilus assembly protein TadB
MSAILLAAQSVIERLLALIGVALLLVLIYALDYPPLEVLLSVLAALMIYVGVWRLTGRLVARRLNKSLRVEVNEFLSLVRRLDTGKKTANAAAVQEASGALRQSLERILKA